MTIYRMAEHKSWGNTMFWWRVPDESGCGCIHGHLRERPQPGDRIVCAMQSGRNAIFEVQTDGNLYPFDPPDQYFVNVKFAGYEDGEDRRHEGAVPRVEDLHGWASRLICSVRSRYRT